MSKENDSKQILKSANSMFSNSYPINNRTSLLIISKRWNKAIKDTAAILKESGFTFFVKDGYDVSTAVAARLVDEDYIDGGVPDLWDLSGAKKLTEVEVDVDVGTTSTDESIEVTAKPGMGFLNSELYFDGEYTLEHLKVISASVTRSANEVFIKGSDLEQYEKQLLKKELSTADLDVESMPLYLDPENEYYSVELGMAIEAHKAVVIDGWTKGPRRSGYSEYLKEWLREQYPDASYACIERIASVANPKKDYPKSK